jgi:hypothetical protein
VIDTIDDLTKAIKALGVIKRQEHDNLLGSIKQVQDSIKTIQMVSEAKNEVSSRSEVDSKTEVKERLVAPVTSLTGHKSKQHWENIGSDAGRMGQELLDRFSSSQSNKFIYGRVQGLGHVLFRRTLPTDGVQ